MGINLLQNIALGVVSFFSLTNLFLIGIGTFCGIIIGAMPGLSTTMGIALFVPFTFSLSPIAGLAMLGGLYNGSVYGGSISAILLRTPGTAASCATVFDGYPMTQKGQGAKALGIALVSSFIGGILGAVILLSLAPPLASFALSFGPPEYFMVAVLGLTIIISLSDDKSLIKGFLAGAFGLLIATVGFDTIEGFPRFTFGNVGLYDGVSLVPALIGLFSFSQALR
ncbi:MAG: tripartite tricarboxylate transporter permease, partial [Acetomicrobium sp.]